MKRTILGGAIASGDIDKVERTTMAISKTAMGKKAITGRWIIGRIMTLNRTGRIMVGMNTTVHVTTDGGNITNLADEVTTDIEMGERDIAEIKMVNRKTTGLTKTNQVITWRWTLRGLEKRKRIR